MNLAICINDPFLGVVVHTGGSHVMMLRNFRAKLSVWRNVQPTQTVPPDLLTDYFIPSMKTVHVNRRKHPI